VIKEYKISKHNSTVCGYPGRDFDWSKFDWDGKSIFKSIFRGQRDMKAPLPWVDDGLIAENCEYLHVPYNYTDQGTIFRVRPNDSMLAGEVYRGRLVKAQKAIEKDDGWYWQLELEGDKVMGDLFEYLEQDFEDVGGTVWQLNIAKARWQSFKETYGGK